MLVYCDCSSAGKRFLDLRKSRLPLRGSGLTAGASRCNKYSMNFRTHTSVTALEPQEIQYDTDLGSLQPVRSVGVSRGGLNSEGASALLFSGYDYTGTVSSVTLRLSVDRQARIQDKTIDLWHSGTKLGLNRADLSAENVWVYTWTGLNLEWTAESGVVVDLQPHTQYPSSSTVRIRSVELAFNQ